MAHKLDDKGRRDPNLNNRRIQEALPEWFVSDNIKLFSLDKLTILCFGSKVAKTIFLVNSFAPVILLNKVDLPEFV